MQRHECVREAKSMVSLSNPIEDVRDGTLADAAYDRLRQDIITGERAPGERLRIERLKGIYAIGPTPLREAMQRLSQDGLVTAQGNRGFTVAPLDPAEFADLNIARTAVEKEALRLSIANGGTEWEAGIVAAAYILKKEDGALESADGRVPDSWERANAEFHAALVSACGSNWLLRIRSGLQDLCERYLRAAINRGHGARNLQAEHASILEAALQRDTNRACQLLEEHFVRTAATLSGGQEDEPTEAQFRSA